MDLKCVLCGNGFQNGLKVSTDTTNALTGQRLLFKIYEVIRKNFNEKGSLCQTCYGQLLAIENMEHDLRTKADNYLEKGCKRKGRNDSIHEEFQDRNSSIISEFEGNDLSERAPDDDELKEVSPTHKNEEDNDMLNFQNVFNSAQNAIEEGYRFIKHEKQNFEDVDKKSEIESLDKDLNFNPIQRDIEMKEEKEPLNHTVKDEEEPEYELDLKFEILNFDGPKFIHDGRILRKNRSLLYCSIHSCQFKGILRNDKFLKNLDSFHNCQPMEREIALLKLQIELREKCVQDMKASLNDIYEADILHYPFKEDLVKSKILFMMRKFRIKRFQENRKENEVKKRISSRGCNTFYDNMDFEAMRGPSGGQVYLHDGFMFKHKGYTENGAVYVRCSDNDCPAVASITDGKFMMKTVYTHTCDKNSNRLLKLEKNQFYVNLLNVAIEKANLSPEEVIKIVIAKQAFKEYKNWNQAEREHWVDSVNSVRKRLLLGKITATDAYEPKKKGK